MVGNGYWMPPPRQFQPTFQVSISNQTAVLHPVVMIRPVMYTMLPAIVRLIPGAPTVVRQKPGSSSHQLEGPRQSLGVHHPNSRAHTKVWESMVKVSKKNVKRGGNG